MVLKFFHQNIVSSHAGQQHGFSESQSQLGDFYITITDHL